MSENTETKAFTAAYKQLNSAQKKAVDAIEGPVMVVAGPGTGKTQILTLRIANILKETQANPEDILALTFTNAGVRAMRDRLRLYIGDAAFRVGIFTFHSFSEFILKEYNSYFKEHEFSEVISDLEKVQILEGILQQHEFSKLVSTYDRFSSLKQIMNAVDAIKQEGISPERYEAIIPAWEEALLTDENMFYKVSRGKYQKGDVKPAEEKKVKTKVAKARELATVYAAYQAELQKRHRYDFSDMILTVLNELAKSNELRMDVSERYQYILVDEHQDTNEGQNLLIEYLTSAEHLDGHPNLFTVGDEKQSIYRFQGASVETFKHFTDYYKDVKVVDLVENYRSTAPILDAAHSVIEQTVVDSTKLKSNKTAAVNVMVREFTDYKFELLFVAEDIKQRLAEGVEPEEIAIIYRSNKHLAELKPILQANGIPYHVRSKDVVLDDPRVRMLIELFKVIANPHDDHSLGKLLLADFLQHDALLVADILRQYRIHKRDSGAGSLFDLLEKKQTFSATVTLVKELVTYDANHLFAETFKHVLEKSGYLEAILKRSDSRLQLQKIEVLFNEARVHAERDAGYRTANFVAFLEATESYQLTIEATAASVGTGVQCMTAHGSKGLEFECVYIVNTTAKNWEKSRGFSPIALPLNQYQGDLDDERRLFYVAMTRAKTCLNISSATQDWQGKSLEPSQFIAELDDNFTEYVDTENFEMQHEDKLIEFLRAHQPADSLFATEYLWNRYLQENLSVTALNNYLECPLKYLFRNLIQLPDVYSPALRYGDAVHRALETFFKEALKENHIPDRDYLLATYESALKTAGFYDTEFERFLLKGKQSLGMYYDFYHTEWSTKVSLEEYIRRTLQIGDIELTLSGKIDKIEFIQEIGTGPIVLIDYKTGKPFSKKSTKAQKEALERQIHFYHLLLQDYKDGKVHIKEALLDFVEPTDDNEFEKKSFTVTEEDLRSLIVIIQQMAQAIKTGTFISAGCEKKDCEYCNLYRTVQQTS